MKVLLSAMTCHPHLGSESKVGWDAARAISEIPAVEECHVMTHTVNREAILQAQQAGSCQRVRFHFFGKPFSYHPNRMLARLQSWLIYRKWQAGLLPFAQSLHRAHSFDLSHHVTIVTWRVASPLWRLPIPFVWGPIGGTALMPRAFLGILSPSARLFEAARYASGRFSIRSKAFLNCAKQSAAVVAANEETSAFFLPFRSQAPIFQLWPVFFSPEQIASLRNAPRAPFTAEKPLQLFAGGNLEGRKGVALALETVAELKKRGVGITYTFGGGGPELHSLQKMSSRLDIDDRVEFHGGFQHGDYIKRLKESDVYFLPSFRETSPITLLEATLAGCFPVVADSSGAGEIVQRIGGKAVPVRDRTQLVRGLADAIEWCSRNRETIRTEAQEASQKVADQFGQAAYTQAIERIYRSVAVNK
jgi:glycosyltransferase involved in cell wall biosynthesis